MLLDSPKLLEDVRDAGNFIIKITESLSEMKYAQNRLVRQAVERNFEIIGAVLKVNFDVVVGAEAV